MWNMHRGHARLPHTVSRARGISRTRIITSAAEADAIQRHWLGLVWRLRSATLWKLCIQKLYIPGMFIHLKLTNISNRACSTQFCILNQSDSSNEHNIKWCVLCVSVTNRKLASYLYPCTTISAIGSVHIVAYNWQGISGSLNRQSWALADCTLNINILMMIHCAALRIGCCSLL